MAGTENTANSVIKREQSEAPTTTTINLNQGDATASSGPQKGRSIPRGPNLKLNANQQVDLLSICVRNKGSFGAGGKTAFWEKAVRELSQKHGKEYKFSAIQRIGRSLGDSEAKIPPGAGELAEEWTALHQIWVGVHKQRLNPSHDDQGANGRSEGTPSSPSAETHKRYASPELPYEGKKPRREAVTPGPVATTDVMDEVRAHLQFLQTQMATMLRQQSEILKELRGR